MLPILSRTRARDHLNWDGTELLLSVPLPVGLFSFRRTANWRSPRGLASGWGQGVIWCAHLRAPALGTRCALARNWVPHGTLATFKRTPLSGPVSHLASIFDRS